MAPPSPTAKNVSAKCKFILAFTTPSADNDRLSDFIKIAVSSACGIPDANIHLDKLESRLDTGKTSVEFSLTGKTEIDVWTMVTRIRKAVADKGSPLNTVGMMKRVFNGAIFEGFDPSSEASRKEPKYHLKAAVDPRTHAHLPTPVVESKLLESSEKIGPVVAPKSISAGKREIRSPKVTVSFPRGARRPTEASWRAKSPSSLEVSILSPSSKISVPTSPHIPLNASHYPFDVVMIPAGMKSPRERDSPKREVHVHLPPATLTVPDPASLKGGVKFIDLKPLEYLISRPVPVIPHSLLQTITELKHVLTISY